MANISVILAALFCATAPIASVIDLEPKKESVESNYLLGQDVVKKIRNSYAKGEFNQFLTEVDSAYKEANLSGLIELRKDKKDVFEQATASWEKRLLDLQKEKAFALLSAVKDTDDSVLAQKVRSLSVNLTPEQEKAVMTLNSLISKAPGTGANADENALINIDVEYEFKLLHANVPAKELSSQEKIANQMALRMEKMDKMVKASKNFTDIELKNAVGTAADTFDVRMARILDASDLNKLSKGKATNQSEEKVASVISLYQEKFSALMKEVASSIK